MNYNNLTRRIFNNKIKIISIFCLSMVSCFAASAQYTLNKVSTAGTYGQERGDFSFINDSVGFYFAGNKILKTTNKGETWTNLVPSVSSLTHSTANYIGGTFVTDKIGWVVLRQFDNLAYINDSSFLYKTIDGGTSWTLQRVNPPNTISYAAATFWKVYFKNTLEGFVYGKDLLEHTKDGGKTWTTIIHETGNKNNDNIFQGIHFVDNNNGYLVGYGSRIAYTNDGGNTWTNQHYYPGLGVTDDYFIYGVDFENKDTGVACIGHGIFKRTLDAGKTWKDFNTGSPDDNNAVRFGPNHTLWLGAGDYCDNTGCYYSSSLIYSDDYGTTWKSLIDDNSANKFIALAWPSKSYGFAATYKGEIYKIKAPASSTSIQLQEEHTLPKLYPNPAKDQLILDAKSELDYYCIVDMMGKLVLQQENISNKTPIIIDIAKLAPGNYFLKYKTRAKDAAAPKAIHFCKQAD